MFHAPRKLLQLSLVSFFLCGLFWAIPHTTAASIIQSDWSGGGGVDHSFVVDNIDTYDISDMISTSADSLTLVPLPNNSDRFLTTYLGIGTTFSKVVDTGSGYVIANANNLYRLAYNGQLQNSYQLESQYGTPNINSVLKVGDNIVLAGGTSSYQPNGYIIILDGDMNTVAQYHLTGTEESGSIQYEPITFMKPTSDGGYIITMGGGSYTDLIMIKLNSDFSVAWGHWYYTRFYFSVGDIVEQAGGGYVISGVMDRDIDNGQNLDIEGFLMSVSPGGYVSAAVFHDGANYTGSLKLGSEIIAYGTEDNNSMLTSIAVSSGNISINWQKILSGVTIRTAYPGTGGHYYLAGTTSDNYLWLAEINENQEIVWSKRYDTIATPFAIMTTATRLAAVKTKL